jgi:hypothetical protein
VSVLACNRFRCDGTMCHRYSVEHGYICADCFEELCVRGPSTSISDFMKSPKTLGNSHQASRAYFEVVFSDGTRNEKK